MKDRAPLLATAVLGTGMLASCGQETPPPFDMPELQTMNVACMNVEGINPYTEDGCAQVAKEVEAGLKLIHDQTAGRLSVPKVTHKLYNEKVNIQDARGIRCTDFAAENVDPEPMKDLMHAVANAAIRQEASIDLKSTGMYVAVNAPIQLCNDKPVIGPKPTEKKPKPQAERCPTKEAKNAQTLEIGRALSELGKPIIFSFTEITAPRYSEKKKFTHEYLHLGHGQRQMGHEYALCNTDADTVPSKIGPSEPSLSLSDRSPEASIMSPIAGSELYVAMPQQLLLGAIQPSRVEKIRSTTTLKLVDTKDAGTAIAELPLTNRTIKKLVKTNLNKRAGLTEADYNLSIAKIPGQEEIGIYAAPMANEKRQSTPFLFLLKRLAKGEQFQLSGDVELDVKAAGPDGITVTIKPEQ